MECFEDFGGAIAPNAHPWLGSWWAIYE